MGNFENKDFLNWFKFLSKLFLKSEMLDKFLLPFFKTLFLLKIKLIKHIKFFINLIKAKNANKIFLEKTFHEISFLVFLIIDYAFQKHCFLRLIMIKLYMI